MHFLAFGLGTGAVPYAPGTAGTLLAVALYYALHGLAPLVYIVSTIAVILAGVWLCGRTARDIGVHDHPGIVWDEIAGYFVTMVLAPQGPWWPWVGFVLFRLFDIWKPFPIRRLDRRLGGGLGIVADDVLAGVYAAVVLQVAAWIVLGGPAWAG